VITNLALIATNRSWSTSIVEILQTPNTAMWWVVAGASVVLALALYVPFLKELFHFSTLHLNDITLCIGAGAVSLAWFETPKAFQRRRRL
jgi:P-type Ca2+ transporter type 2C